MLPCDGRIRRDTERWKSGMRVAVLEVLRLALILLPGGPFSGASPQRWSDYLHALPLYYEMSL